MRIAKNRISIASRNKRGRVDGKIDSILSLESDIANDKASFVLDGGLGYVAEKRDFRESPLIQDDAYVEIVLTRFPHLDSGSSMVSEGVRVRVYKPGKGESFIEYQMQQKDKTEKAFKSPPVKIQRQPLVEQLLLSRRFKRLGETLRFFQ